MPEKPKSSDKVAEKPINAKNTFKALGLKVLTLLKSFKELAPLKKLV